MNLAALSIEKRAITYFGILLILAGGMFCYFQLGQLEDPEFSVKTAVITTTYPGASAEQVELEITDRIETKLQEMVELKNVYSNSRPGLSIIKVDIKSNYWSDRLPQVWDVLRKKVQDIESSLPPGAGKPKVGDDFGYVFGFLLAVSSDGYSYAELERYVKDMRKELSVVPGVARVDLWGVQEKRIYIDVSTAQLSELGLTPEQMMQTLQSQNLVVDAGRVDYQTQRLRVAPTGEFQSPEDIGDLAIAGAGGGRDEIVRIRDFATVTFGYVDPPSQLLRHNGRQAIALALAPGAGENVVAVGQAIDRRLAELVADLPVGIGVERISWQSDQVSESIRAFMISLLEAVVIVLALLALTMGMRAGIIIGISGLVFPILGTFIVMAIVGIDLHRISLGALIIAMGMMVDNAIVVTDGIMVRIAQGMDRKQAAIEAASGPAWPLLGATVVACMAFYPIFASTYDTGEYAGSLFTVVAISLLLSWVFCQTVGPLLCIAMLPAPKPGQAVVAPYQSPFYQRFRRILSLAIRYRVLFLGSLIGLLVLSDPRLSLRAATVLSRLQPLAGHDRLLGTGGHADPADQRRPAEDREVPAGPCGHRVRQRLHRQGTAAFLPAGQRGRSLHLVCAADREYENARRRESTRGRHRDVGPRKRSRSDGPRPEVRRGGVRRLEDRGAFQRAGQCRSRDAAPPGGRRREYPARLPRMPRKSAPTGASEFRPWFPATTRSAAAGPACRATIWPARRGAHPTAWSSVNIGRRTI